jgi:hypothetical protein
MREKEEKRKGSKINKRKDVYKRKKNDKWHSKFV